MYLFCSNYVLDFYHFNFTVSLLIYLNKAELTSEQIDKMKAAFNLFDKDGSGSLSAEDLKQAFSELGETNSDEEIKKMVLL